MLRFAAVLLLPAICLFLADPTGAAEPDLKTLDFIYVNANTGEAAGGHTAVRLGTTVFHFQFFPQGRFLLVRDSWSHFRYVYNELRNRSIFIGRLPLAQPVYTALRNHFTGLLIAQQQALNRLRDAETQLQLAEQLIGGAGEVELPTVGLFDPDSTGDVALTELRSRILHRLGATFFAHMRAWAEEKLARLTAVPEKRNGLSRSSVLQETLLEREYIGIVERGASLNRDAVIAPSIDAADLGPDELDSLMAYREELAESIIRLLQSKRPDRGGALLLQTARYLAVSRSLATGRLYTLDPFSRRAVSVSAAQGDELQGLYAQLTEEAVRARHDFFQESKYPDIAYAILETSLGRLHEVEGAIFTGMPVRVEQGMLLPSRSDQVSIIGIFNGDLDLEGLIAEKKDAVTRLRRQVVDRYGYDLVRRNCATELVRAINSAFPDAETGRGDLGGWLDPGRDLVFIPNRFYSLAGERFALMDEEIQPSRRLRKLNTLYETGLELPVWLQESNTLSSTLYSTRTGDTPFLFFTDNVSLLRPIFGLTNFCWAAVSGMAGVFTLPLDGGERIHQAFRGMFYSLPELVFCNIRKGTYGFARTIPAGP